MLPALARELRTHRERQRELGIHRIAPTALLFQTEAGKPVSRRNVLSAVNLASVEAKLIRTLPPARAARRSRSVAQVMIEIEG